MSNYLINIDKFFIIKENQLQYILDYMNITYTTDISFYIGLILTNIFAIIIIYFLYRVIKTLFNYFFRRITIFKWD